MGYSIPIILIFAPIASIISIILALFLARIVRKREPGNEAMQRVAGYIEEGAGAFLKRQYSTLFVFVAILAVVILLLLPNPITPGVINWQQMIAYVIGSLASAFAGWLGMIVGVKANTRTAEAARHGFSAAFEVSFYGGAVMGLAVVGAALTGVSVLYFIFATPQIILGFSFGASSIALFAKAGGGIYTKTADVAADLVGKGEYDLPEDDPRNPAAVADNVGDNVGDIAGMGADLFDSYVASIVACMILGTTFVINSVETSGMMIIYPIVVSASGLIASIIAIIVIKSVVKDNPGKALNNGTYIATAIFLGINLVITFIAAADPNVTDTSYLWKNFISAAMGLLAGVLIGFTTDYYTNDERKPTKNIAKAGESGHATVILSGFAYGLESVAAPTIGIIIAMTISYILSGLYGIAFASVGMLAIIGTIVSNDAYGPIVDNARGIAEQGGLDEEVIRLCDRLDSAGNTAKAITKGFAIGAAALTVLALLYAYTQEAGVTAIGVNLLNPDAMIGALIGAMMPPLFSAVLIKAVQKNAEKMIAEIRRQFTEMPGILDNTQKADYAKCVDIATKGALRELIIPVIISIVGPVATGIIFGRAALGAFLAASILTGFIFALLMSNAGGAWDNAKKYVEDGNLGGKGTETHKAVITGDTVGDPFKDTAGPSINTLICVMSLTASMFIGIFGNGIIQFASSSI